MKTRAILTNLALIGALAANSYSQEYPSNIRTRSHAASSTPIEPRPGILEALIIQESGANPFTPPRYEKHLDTKSGSLEDTSYGISHFIPDRALEIKAKHPELPDLGNTEEQIIASLQNPQISFLYTRAAFTDDLNFYGSEDLALAAHNGGQYRPLFARVQWQLNDLLGSELETDGLCGPKTKEIIKKFQKKHGLKATGTLGHPIPESKTYIALQREWTSSFPNSPNPRGVMPDYDPLTKYVKEVKARASLLEKLHSWQR